MPDSPFIPIEVVYVTNPYQCLALEVPVGTTIRQAIAQAGMLAGLSEAQCHKVGIFGEFKSWDLRLKAGDRIEIYSPIRQRAIEARIERVKQQRLNKRNRQALKAHP